MKRVEGFSNLFKNESGAIVNTDLKAYEKAKERKKEKEKVAQLENRLDRIEQLLMEILSK